MLWLFFLGLLQVFLQILFALPAIISHSQAMMQKHLIRKLANFDSNFIFQALLELLNSFIIAHEFILSFDANYLSRFPIEVLLLNFV